MNVALKHMSPDEFLKWSLDQPDRWELVHGVPIRMMTGASNGHDDVVINVIAGLKERLRGKPCRPRTADVASRMTDGNLRRPDVTVDCGASEPKSLETKTPTVFFEVLSRSTRTIDMVRKAEEYKSLPSARHIVLLEPDRPRAWLWSRLDETADWTHQDIEGADGVIDLTAIGVNLPFSVVYDGVSMDD